MKENTSFFLNYLVFFYGPMDVGNLVFHSSAFSKSSLNIWKFSSHIEWWSLTWRIMSTILLACEMSTILWKSEHSLHCPSLILEWNSLQFSSDQFSCSVVSDSLWPHELQQARPPCSSPAPGVRSDSRPSSQWCHPAISSSVVPFSTCPQSLPASGSFPVSQFFSSGGQSIDVSASASVLPINIQD